MEFELRPWRMEDAETIARYANNPKIAANLRDAFPHPYTQRDAETFIQSCLDADPARCCFRAIAVNGEAVGSISLSIGEDISSKSAELGYWSRTGGRGLCRRQSGRSAALPSKPMALRASSLCRSPITSPPAASWKRQDSSRKVLCGTASTSAACSTIPIYMRGRAKTDPRMIQTGPTGKSMLPAG